MIPTLSLQPIAPSAPHTGSILDRSSLPTFAPVAHPRPNVRFGFSPPGAIALVFSLLLLLLAAVPSVMAQVFMHNYRTATFSTAVTGFPTNTLINVRAYAINNVGTH